MSPIEAAFREGYKEGYKHGGDDATSYEWGHGSKRPEIQKREEDETWQGSEARLIDDNEI